MFSEVKSNVQKQEFVFKGPFFLTNSFYINIDTSLERQWFKKVKFHTGHGVRKVPRKGHVLFEWPHKRLNKRLKVL